MSSSSTSEMDETATSNDSRGGEQLQPPPFPHQFRLYLMHFAFSFTSRMWDMGIVLFIAIVTHNSLFIVALCGLISSLSIFLFMPTIGPRLDKLDRFVSVKASLAIKIIAITLSYGICGIANGLPGKDQNEVGYYSPVILIVPFLCGIVSLAFSTVVQCVEKDWVVVLSNGNSKWLSSTNSVMSQIDLGTASIAPVVTGTLFSFLSQSSVAITLLLLNAITTVLLYNFMRNLYFSLPALAVKKSEIASSDGNKQDMNAKSKGALSSSEVVDFSDSSSTDQDILSLINPKYWCSRVIEKIEEFFLDFSISGCSGTMFAYSFLYFTVLSFGSLMTVYLRWAGISDYWIGLARGINSLMGFTGAWLFPSFNARFGLWKTGQIAIMYQSFLVVIAASSFFFSDRKHAVIVVVVATLLSRKGLWMFDLAARQICQETIPEAARGKVNGQWRSMIAFFDMGGYVAATIFPDPRQFWLLTSISAIMVLSALVTFSMNNPEVDMGTVRSLLCNLIPTSIAAPLSAQYQNIFINSSRNGTGIDISQHENGSSVDNDNDFDKNNNNNNNINSNNRNIGRLSKQDLEESSGEGAVVEMVGSTKYFTGNGKHKVDDIDDVEEITL